MENIKTFRFGVTHIEYGYVDIKAENEKEAREIAEEGGCANAEINKCEIEINELIEVK